MFSFAFAFKGQVHVLAGRVKIVSHSFCNASAVLKYFCPLDTNKIKMLIKCSLSSAFIVQTGSPFILTPPIL